jgi:hypothetical protein
MSAQLTINLPHVVHETIDGETILIHLGTGTYYSLDGVGAEVWALLVAGASAVEVAVRMTTRYDADPALVGRTVGSLVDELIQEGLLAHAPPDSAPVAQRGETEGEVECLVAGPFVSPLLRKYTDMQEFMLVDPLHDVEADAGWPHVKVG